MKEYIYESVVREVKIEDEKNNSLILKIERVDS